MQFHGQFTVAKAKEAGIDKFTYTGTLVRDSREFCQRMLNRTLTEEQIREIWNTQGWAGKSTGDPFIVRGGYRCRHTWIPTVDEIEDEIPEQPEEEQEEPAPIKKGRRSTLNNPVKESEIDVISSSIVADRLQKQITKNAKDERYDVGSRFRTSNVGKVTGVEKLDDEIASQLNSIMQELDELAELYNVPKLRSITVTAKKRALMAMGDGNLYINPKYFNRKNVDASTQRSFRNALFGEGAYNKESRLADDYVFNNKNKSKQFISRIKKERKTKPDTWERPHNAFYFFEEEMDKFRNIAYHEFGHQVHQMKNKTIGLWDFAPIEDALRQKVKSINGGATRYSNANTKEWFAENFSLYHMGREELVDPKFIEFLENEVLK
jgi:hypothetical protein